MPRRFAACLALVVCATALPGARGQRDVPEPAALAASGWTAVEERRFGDALEAFTRAIGLAAEEPTFWLGAGVAAYMLGRTTDAETSLVRALVLDPTLHDAAFLLGDLQYRGGRVPEAIATYEAALTRTPGEPAFTARLDEWRTDARVSGRFFESRGAHFRVLFEGPADETLARRAVDMLETAYWRVGGALNAYPTQAITVVLYTQDQFRDVTRGPEWSGGTYDGRIRLPVRGALDTPAELERVLIHEFLHAIVAMLGGPTVPVWVNEGLATVFEPGGLERSERVLAEAATRPRLRDLHDGFGGLSRAAAAVAYATSAVAVRRMLELQGAPAMVALLQDLARGVQFPAAFHQRMAVSYEEFQVTVARRR